MILRKTVCGWLVIQLMILCLGSARADAGPWRSPDLSAGVRTYSPGPDVFQDQDPAPKKSWARRHPVWTTVIVVLAVEAVLASLERSEVTPA